MNPNLEGYDLEESLAFYKKQLEQAIKHAKQAVKRNATVVGAGCQDAASLGGYSLYKNRDTERGRKER